MKIFRYIISLTLQNWAGHQGHEQLKWCRHAWHKVSLFWSWIRVCSSWFWSRTRWLKFRLRTTVDDALHTTWRRRTCSSLSTAEQMTRQFYVVSVKLTVCPVAADDVSNVFSVGDELQRFQHQALRHSALDWERSGSIVVRERQGPITEIWSEPGQSSASNRKG